MKYVRRGTPPEALDAFKNTDVLKGHKRFRTPHGEVTVVPPTADDIKRASFDRPHSIDDSVESGKTVVSARNNMRANKAKKASKSK